MPEKGRAKWGRQVEFVLTLIGFAVGLGNVWRFPYLCFKNGGGAFLIPYTLSLIFLGIPIFAMECALGQYGGKGPLSIWSVNPAFKGLGMSLVLAIIVVFIYYNIVISWSLRFLVASFTSHLPWIDCNDCSCLLYGASNITDQEIEIMKTNNSLGIPCPDISLNKTVSKSELYFTQVILTDTGSLEDIGYVKWEILLANFVAYLIIFLVLVKGVETLGKVTYFSTIFPYILLTILLVRCALLDGAYDGVLFYLTPQWERLKEGEVWSDAAVQIFFSLSACSGGLIAMSSYNNFNNNIIRDAFIVPIVNCLTSFYAGFVVFSTLGNMAHTNNLPIANVTQGGPGLAFIVYPEALGNMPVSTLWSILFFCMLCMLGFSTQFSVAETVMTAIIDEFPNFLKGRKRQVMLRAGVCLGGFILGIPMTTQGGSHLLDIVDSALVGFPLLIFGLVEFFVLMYVYGYSRFAADVKAMVGYSPFIYFKATWIVISPVMILALVVFKAYQMKDFTPPWKGLLYYLIVLFLVIWIPLYFFVYTCPRGIFKLMKPKKEWIDRIKLSKNKNSHESEGVDDLSIVRHGFGHYEITVPTQAEMSKELKSDAENQKGKQVHADINSKNENPLNSYNEPEKGKQLNSAAELKGKELNSTDDHGKGNTLKSSAEQIKEKQLTSPAAHYKGQEPTSAVEHKKEKELTSTAEQLHTGIEAQNETQHNSAFPTGKGKQPDPDNIVEKGKQHHAYINPSFEDDVVNPMEKDKHNNTHPGNTKVEEGISRF